MSQKTLKISLLLFLISLIILFFIYEMNEYSSLQNIKRQYQNLLHYYDKNNLLIHIIFIFIYIITTSLSLPFALALTLFAGALFGFWYGLILVSFGSTIGATIAFLIARFIGYEYVRKNYKNQLSKFHNGFKKEGAFYLFALRMVPLFPFFMINIFTALMPIKTWTFYWVSQVGMLPGTFLYVFAGTQLSEIKSLSDIMSPTLIVTFIFIGFFPILVKEVFKYLKNKSLQK
ncbi:TVP38/TMEM64 family protein [Alphaproteobacteria bacterium]|nr:TVP38/TMEM64 family protein [Alphaproteobacteria bacterium]